MTLRIEWVQGAIRLCGEFRVGQLDEVKTQIERCESAVLLDLLARDISRGATVRGFAPENTKRAFVSKAFFDWQSNQILDVRSCGLYRAAVGTLIWTCFSKRKRISLEHGNRLIPGTKLSYISVRIAGASLVMVILWGGMIAESWCTNPIWWMRVRTTEETGLLTLLLF
jgi:hypothetical protein